MDDLKAEFQFKQLVKNTKQLIKRDTQYIPNVEELSDGNKGRWIDHGDDFTKAFDGLLDFCADEGELDNLDWNTVNYQAYGADYYEQRFPGFDERVYDILAQSTIEENRLIDETIPPLKISHEGVTLSFS